jgi:molecular chaperone GrpE
MMNDPYMNEPNPAEHTTPDASPSAADPAVVDIGPARVDALQAELDKTKDQMLRALAEAENNRKRALKERDDASKYAVSSFAKDMLNVADNLRRALDAVPIDLREDSRVKALIEGIEATEREMLRGFEKTGIRKITPDGELFNPNYHEVMFEAPGSGKPPGTIIQIIDSGYILHDRLLRPARVGVAKDEGQGLGNNGGKPGSQIDTKA